MNGTAYLLHERRGYFSEHRYDALGRRVLVRTRRDGLCRKGTSTIADCTGGITRYVWAGDNLLWEMRGPGADSVPATRLDDVSASDQEFGVVGYTHAAGIDRPLVVWKGTGVSPTDVVVPHANWRGVFGKGTTSSGGTSNVAIEWPGFKTTAYHRMGPGQQQTTNWMGSLIGGQRDPGGTMYMRNRYYDPGTGQFTQTDPIGIAGGFNAYAFAAGDPVNQYDPFGTECEQVSSEKLRCTNVGAPDFYSIKNFLGGEAGADAFATFTGGTDPWNRENCGRMRFTSAQCSDMAEGLSHLTLHSNAECRALGLSATRRFQRRLYRYTGANYGAMSIAPWSSRVRIGRWAFDPAYPAPLAEVIAHEEKHVRSYWRFVREGSSTHDAPGMHNRPDLWDFVWKTGNLCGK